MSAAYSVIQASGYYVFVGQFSVVSVRFIGCSVVELYL